MKMIRDKEATYAELKAAGKYDEADKLWWEDEESLKSKVIILRICVVIPLNFINR